MDKLPPSPPLLAGDVVFVKNDDDNDDDDDDDENEQSPSTSNDACPKSSAAPAAVDSSLQEAPPPPPPNTVYELPRLSRFLKWYTNFISSSGNQDIGLKFLQYTLWMTAKVIGNSKSISAFCSKLSTDLSYARYMTRLFGLPAAMEAALHGTWASDSSTTSNHEKNDGSRRRLVDVWLGKILAYSMIFYYPAEHLAFVHWMAPPSMAGDDSSLQGVCKMPLPPRTAERWCAWSCRFWVVYIIAETIQCILQWCKHLHEKQCLLFVQQQQQQQQAMEMQEKSKSNNSKEQKCGQDGCSSTMIQTKLHETKRALHNAQLQLLRNALFILPAIHWSLPNWDVDPWLPVPLVYTLMWLETMVHFYKVSM